MGTVQELERLSVRLVGDGSAYLKMLRGAVAATETAAKKITKTAKSISNIGLKMSLGFTLPVAGMVKGYASFDDAMTKSTAIMSGVTKELRHEMERTAYSIARNSVTSATELAKSYYYLASAGMDAQQAIKALPVVERFAVAGAFDMALATDLLTDAQSALGLSSKDAEQNMLGLIKVSDILVRANTLANASVQQFSEALTNEAGPAIKQYNMDLEEGVAILATYADQGLKGDAAGSMMGRMIRLLIMSINKNWTAFSKLGIKVKEFAATGKNVTGVIEGITRAVQGMGPAQKAATLESLGFEARIQQAILPLLGMTDKIKGYEDALRQASEYTKMVAQKQLESFAAQMKILWNRVREVSDLIGKELAPYITYASKLISIGIEYWNELNGSVKHNIAVFIGVMAILGPVLVVLGTLGGLLGGVVFGVSTLGSVLAFVISTAVPFTAVLVAISGILWFIYTGIKDAIDVTWGWDNALKKTKDTAAEWGKATIGWVANIGENFKRLMPWIEDNWKNMLRDLIYAFQYFTINVAHDMNVFAATIFGAVFNAIRDPLHAGEAITNTIVKMLGEFKTPFDGFKSSLTELPEFVYDVWKDVWEEASRGANDAKPPKLPKIPDAITKAYTPGGTEATKDPGQFKQMSLNQFSINPVGNSRKETQQVSDVGVQNKLDQFMNLVRGQKPVSVLGR